MWSTGIEVVDREDAADAIKGLKVDDQEIHKEAEAMLAAAKNAAVTLLPKVVREGRRATVMISGHDETPGVFPLQTASITISEVDVP